MPTDGKGRLGSSVNMHGTLGIPIELAIELGPLERNVIRNRNGTERLQLETKSRTHSSDTCNMKPSNYGRGTNANV